MSSQVSPTGNRTLINHLMYNVQNITNSNDPAFRLLYDHICVAAYDNSDQVDQMKCYPGTRTLFLGRLEHWLSAPGNARRLLMWLDGPMGSGKTAVARTMAERVSANNKLVGVFIFRRGQPGRSDATRFVATLAYQMALSIPLVRPHIEEQLNHDPSILQKSLSRQIDLLILEPLRRMRSRNPDIDLTTLPNLVVVDGLDECGGNWSVGDELTQTRVLDSLYRLASSQNILPFSILILSRPENHIRNWFNTEPHGSMTDRLSLDATYKPDDDIRLFVRESFFKILRDHPNRHLLPPNWPFAMKDPWGSEEESYALSELVRRSSGVFIYAAVAMEYIASPKHRPDKRLLSVISSDPNDIAVTADSPTAILDALYLHILNSTDDHATVKKVLAFYHLFQMNGLPPNVSLDRALATLLSISVEDLEHCLRQLESVLVFRLRPRLRFHHSSFREFLKNPSRSGTWFVDRDHYFSQFLVRLLRTFHDATYVGTQISCLRLAHFLQLQRNIERRDTIPMDLHLQKDLELEWFCNYPHSSYNVSVEHFLSKVPLSIFIRLTQWIPTERLKDILCSHLAPLIKPHIQPYLKDSESFAHFLCWAVYVPDSKLAINSCGDAVVNHRWPGDLRQIVLAHTENPEPLTTRRSVDIKQFTNLFSLPSINFLHDALLIVLTTVELGLRHSRRSNPSHRWGEKWFQGPRNQQILRCFFYTNAVAPNIWIYALDCEQVLPDDFRATLQAELHLNSAHKSRIHDFHHLYNTGQPISPSIVFPLDFALEECARSLDVYQSTLRVQESYWFLRNSDYRQILIPSVPELAVYMWFDYEIDTMGPLIPRDDYIRAS
ncbi:hypothetical protein BJ165DRAFT_1615272 [Panaeolus papilionaceus]|nr:hypothetical protein BJ165DRAFT_1615272 [Panaeolus papilionaceus]